MRRPGPCPPDVPAGAVGCPQASPQPGSVELWREPAPRPWVHPQTPGCAVRPEPLPGAPSSCLLPGLRQPTASGDARGVQPRVRANSQSGDRADCCSLDTRVKGLFPEKSCSLGPQTSLRSTWRREQRMGQQQAQDSGWEEGTSPESSPTRQAPPCAPVRLMVLTNEGGSSVSSSCRREAREATCWGTGTLCVNLVQRSSRGPVRGSVSSGMSGGGRSGGSGAGRAAAPDTPPRSASPPNQTRFGD